MRKILTAVLLATVSMTTVAGCASNLAGSDSGKFNVQNQDSQNKKHSKFHKGGHNFFGLVKDLNLTTEQQAQFKALMQDSFKNFKKGDNKENRQAFHNTLKEAFLSTSFDKAALKNKLAALKPANNDKTTAMAENIIKAYNILTPEQRQKVETHLGEMESKFKNKTGKHKAGGMHEKMFDKMSAELNLTDTQKAQLKTLFEQSAPDRSAMMNKASETKNAVLAALKSGNATASGISSILSEARNGIGGNMDSMIDKMAQVHSILTPEQRQKLVQTMENRKNGFHHKMKKHHR